MDTSHIIEISKNKYVDMNSGMEATAKEIKFFKSKVKSNKQKSKIRFKEYNKRHEDFWKEYGQAIKDLLGEDCSHLSSDHDIDCVVYSFSTALFDCFNSEEKESWLNDVKKRMGKDFYYKVIEGYVLGNHDT